jgi:ornithine cyclodeaminase/alanine dehydrogenase-like protein (mu-crystallin family)
MIACTGVKSRSRLTVGICAVLASDAHARRSDEDITVFDSSGLAIQDPSAARELLARRNAAWEGA